MFNLLSTTSIPGKLYYWFKSKEFYILCLMFLICVALIALRAPNLLLHPRLWAEEGSAYLESVYSENLFGAIFRWYVGYLYLSVSLSAILAGKLVPVAYAPFVTTAIAFVIQALPFFIIFFGKSEIFSGYKRGLGALLLLLAPHFRDEIWLNTTNSHIFFGILTVIILFERLPELPRFFIWLYRFILLLGGLSSAYVFVLFPVYGIKACRERVRERYLQFSILLSSFVVQASFLMVSKLVISALNKRRFSLEGGSETIDHLRKTVINQAMLPLLGRSFYRLRNSFGENLTICAILTLVAIAAIYLYWLDNVKDLRSNKASVKIPDGKFVQTLASKFIEWSKFFDNRLLLFLIWTILALLTAVASFDGATGGRYAIVSGCVFLMLCLDCIRREQFPPLNILILILLGVCIFNGVQKFDSSERYVCDGRGWYQALNQISALESHEDNKGKIEIPICPDNRGNWKVKVPYSLISK